MKDCSALLLCQCFHTKDIHNNESQCRVVGCSCSEFIVYCPSQKSGNDYVVKYKEREEHITRYRSRYMYGRYEVVDELFDSVVCYGYQSEQINEIVRAMNAQDREDNKIL